MDNLVLCDTCVIIDFVNGHDPLLQSLHDSQCTLFFNAIIEMELLYGAHNQRELRKIQQKLNIFRRLELHQAMLDRATHFVTTYTLSHRLNPADAIIAATAVLYDLPLFTHNTKDFKYLPDVRLWQPESVSDSQPKQS
jgi:tRNA(fMet)-specific endonuclease VapC